MFNVRQYFPEGFRRLGRAIGLLALVVVLSPVALSGQQTPRLTGGFPVAIHSMPCRPVCVDVGQDGLVYVGTLDGISVFDGQRWQHYHGQSVMHLTVARNGHIYCVCSSGLGKWVPDETHGLRYVDFKASLAAYEFPGSHQRGFCDVACVGGEVWYCRPDSLVRVTVDAQGREKFRLWKDFQNGTLKCRHVCEVDGRVLVQLETNDIESAPRFARLQGESLVPDPVGDNHDAGHSRVSSSVKYVTDMCRWGESENSVLLAAGTKGAWVSENGVATPIDFGKLKGVAVWYCEQLTDGEYALVTEAHGVLIVDSSMQVQKQIGPEMRITGAARDAAMDPFRRLWIVARNDVIQVDLKSGTRWWSVSDASDLISCRRWKDKLFVLNPHSLHVASCRDGVPDEAFHLVGTSGFRQMEIVDDQLFLVGHRGLFAVDSQTFDLRRISAGAFLTLGHLGDTLIVSHRGHGLEFRTRDTNWAPVQTLQSMSGVHRICSDRMGRLWLEFLREDGFRQIVCVETQKRNEVSYYDQDWRSLTHWNGWVFVVTKQGELLWFHEEQGRFQVASEMKELLSQSGLNVTHIRRVSNDGPDHLVVTDHWGRTVMVRKAVPNRDVVNFEDVTLKNFDVDHLFTSIKTRNSLRVYESDAGHIWGTNGSVVLCDEQLFRRETLPHEYPLVRIHRANQSDSEPPLQRFGLMGNLDAVQVLDPLEYSNRVLRFEYSMPSVRLPAPAEYQTMLVGLDAEWSEWSSNPYREFAALREGQYTFLARARDQRLQPTAATSIPFVVRPPWYRHSATYFLTICSIIVLTGLVVWWRIRDQRRRVAVLQNEVAEHMKTEARLQTANTRLEKLVDTAQTFVSNVSHEFRTPLTVIKDYSAMLAEGIWGDVNREQRNNLHVVRSRVQDLENMVDDLLDSSQLDAGLVAAYRQHEDIHLLIRRLKPTFESKAHVCKVEVKYDICRDLPSVYCDGNKLVRTLTNLISNAVKFSEEGTTVTVSARHSQDTGMVEFSVSDQGPGIDVEEFEKAFSRFGQLNTHTESSVKGFGLGLNIVRQMVDLNLGQIFIDSEPGVGSTFRVTVPSSEPLVVVKRYLQWVSSLSDGPKQIELACSTADVALSKERTREIDALFRFVQEPYDLALLIDNRQWLHLAVADEQNGICHRIHAGRKKHSRSRQTQQLTGLTTESECVIDVTNPLGIQRVLEAITRLSSDRQQKPATDSQWKQIVALEQQALRSSQDAATVSG